MARARGRKELPTEEVCPGIGDKEVKCINCRKYCKAEEGRCKGKIYLCHSEMTQVYCESGFRECENPAKAERGCPDAVCEDFI